MEFLKNRHSTKPKKKSLLSSYATIGPHKQCLKREQYDHIMSPGGVKCFTCHKFVHSKWYKYEDKDGRNANFVIDSTNLNEASEVTSCAV